MVDDGGTGGGGGDDSMVDGVSVSVIAEKGAASNDTPSFSIFAFAFAFALAADFSFRLCFRSFLNHFRSFSSSSTSWM